MTDMIERVARAIDGVQLWMHYNDEAETEQIAICRYGAEGEPGVVIVERHSGSEDDAIGFLRRAVSTARARAAIAAMREPTEYMEDAADEPFHSTWRSERERWEQAEQRRIDMGLPRNLPEGQNAFASGPFTTAIYRAMIDAALKDGDS